MAKEKMKPHGPTNKDCQSSGISVMKTQLSGRSDRVFGNWLVLVALESMAGTGHKLVRIRPKQDGKLQCLHKDPLVQETVLYKEFKKLKTLK
ncbi:39S ribosomal protein L33, mitochondrial-like [Dreissena polymorpha]|uniref:39S ribosomal protein L33, mitochondrial n=1 Tax=Dreissena polymorpha TaxID=45954 RepID=A0A9D4KR79_DREPO|nr:39S ribosomal protein L33, mitochondrial-like [Dreissena polymorpha]KAH3844356.1 hypothetical protein DPMN_086614 [Dreissena polymorpha]